MPVDTQHPEYLAAYPLWSRARAILAGEEAVKTAGTKLLPQIEGHSSLEYDAYKKRASFFNATARTLNGYVGMVFRRAPSAVLPEGLEPVAVFQTDTDLLGTPLRQYAREVFTQVLGVGRCGTLVSWDELEERPHCVLYLAEDIVNWRVARVGNRFRLTMLVLREWFDAGTNFETELKPQYRLFELRSLPDGRTGVAVSVIREVEEGRWNVVENFIPFRGGEPVPLIPFVFHGPSHNRASVSPLPLGDLIAVNIDHYRLDADYKHALHFTALPTAYLFGAGEKTDLKIGGSSVWQCENPQARAGYVEYFGHGLTSFERALERDERLMAVLGSRLLEPEKREAETVEAIALRQAGEESVLGAIARAVSQSLTDVLRWAVWWSSPHGGRVPDASGSLTVPSNAAVGGGAPTLPSTPEDIPQDAVLFTLNQDFGTHGISARDLQAMVASWQAGAFSHDTLFEVLRKGEILPDGRTNEQERTLLTQDGRPTTQR